VGNKRTIFRSDDLRQRVTLQAPTTPTSGETTVTFADTSTAVAAKIEAASARGAAGIEAQRGMQVEARTAWVVTLRYRSDVDPTWRVKWGSRLLNIYSCYDPTNEQKRLEMLCYEVQT
jgi:SPP1 family predicted phage head-tail adaptor